MASLRAADGAAFSAAEVKVFSDGTAHLLTMASDIGQGADTVLKQILAEELGLAMEDIRLTAADTAAPAASVAVEKAPVSVYRNSLAA